MRKAPFILAALLLAACSQTTSVIPEPAAADPGIIVPSPDPWNIQDQSDKVRPGIPGSSSLIAGFEGTRTHLEANSAGTAVKVIWDAGDSFSMLSADLPNKSISRAIYTTSAGGSSAVFTTGNVVDVHSWCYSIYPGYNNVGSYTDYTGTAHFVAGIKLPVNQTAVVAGVEKGLAISYASSTTQTADLLFHNLLCLVRFRISGALASSIKNVTIKGQKQLAGDFVIQMEDGEVSLSEVRFSSSETSNSVTLSGDFVPGQEYIIALLPGSQRLSMIFDDGNGHSTTKNTPNPVNLQSGRVVDFGNIDLGDSFTDALPIAPVLYKQASKGAKPVTIAIIPDAFLESQASDYDLLARDAADAILSVEPFKTYKDYFNIWILYAWSNESGASVTDGNHNITEYHDTFFSSSWGTDNYGDMDADKTKVFQFVSENCPDVVNGVHTINEVPILMLVNDSRYGGICWTFSDGSALGIVPYIYDGSGLAWQYPDITPVSDSDPSAGVRSTTKEEFSAFGSSRGNWLNVVVHEFCGHGFGRLADEYWYNSVGDPVSSIGNHNFPVPFGLNISATYDNTPWQSLLDIKPQLVSINPLYDRIGVFQGGWVSALNRWRSEAISCMIDNRLYFSTWQRVLIVKRIKALAGESFDMNDFVANDVATDPLRDAVSSPTPGYNYAGPARIMPMTPPPVIVEVD